MVWNEEEMKRLKQDDYPAYRRKYRNEKMKSYDWYCDVCNNGKNYTLRGKFMHLKYKKHLLNYEKNTSLIKF